MSDLWSDRRRALGEYIRAQRQLAKLSLRDLAALANVSNPYLSQIERGLHAPSMRVLMSIAEALDLSTDALLSAAGVTPEEPSAAPADGGVVPTTERAIRADPQLSAAQKDALLAVYRSYLAEGSTPG